MCLNTCILLAQKEEKNIESLSTILREHGYYGLVTARDGLDAIKIFEEKSPSIAFVDTALPLADGLTVVSNVRKENKDCLIAVTSSAYDKALVERAAGLGADGFIIEPFSIDYVIPWLMVSYAEKRRQRMFRNEFDMLCSDFNEQLMLEKTIGMIAEQNKMSYEQARAFIEKLSKEKEMPVSKIVQILQK